MIGISARYGTVEKDDDEYTSLADSIQHWNNIEEAGECYMLGIYDPATKTMYIPENMDIAGKSREIVLEQKKGSFAKLGLEIEKMEFYDQGA